MRKFIIMIMLWCLVIVGPLIPSWVSSKNNKRVGGCATIIIWTQYGEEYKANSYIIEKDLKDRPTILIIETIYGEIVYVPWDKVYRITEKEKR